MLEITADGVCARIHPQGGMVTAAFDIDGVVVEPMYEAPWLGQWQGDTLLENLRGDFACVPFGMPGHGYAANHRWVVAYPDDASPGTATLWIDYPEDYAVERLTRRVKCNKGGLEFEDTIDMRRQAELPLGLHPMFKLPMSTEGAPLGKAAFLELPDAEAVLTPPQRPEPTSRLLPGQRFRNVREAPATNGTVDLARLPWAGKSEDLVMLANVAEGRVGLRVDGYTAVLEWETTYLRHCLLWISNRGRDYEPWSGRNLCLGIEPVTSAFDLGAETSAGENPVATEGFQTAVSLSPGKPCLIRHRLSLARSGALPAVR